MLPIDIARAVAATRDFLDVMHDEVAQSRKPGYDWDEGPARLKRAAASVRTATMVCRCGVVRFPPFHQLSYSALFSCRMPSMRDARESTQRNSCSLPAQVTRAVVESPR